MGITCGTEAPDLIHDSWFGTTSDVFSTPKSPSTQNTDELEEGCLSIPDTEQISNAQRN